ncbi:hypothetical protein PVK06_034741 [Gossypium arboreum]|uniref:Uncharacterized protein n=1 Tax=Gossypium arboreum TaxID=29729 RepID=A0ABR0NFK4_GOSAR|nr:hypothetical protein PVK06_034741 [Gossypium arboreum]
MLEEEDITGQEKDVTEKESTEVRGDKTSSNEVLVSREVSTALSTTQSRWVRTRFMATKEIESLTKSKKYTGKALMVEKPRRKRRILVDSSIESESYSGSNFSCYCSQELRGLTFQT